ncbi:MAG: chemotaxis protein CheW [Myxococcales bacterium]|nr:chemotaxis protein CheW [Myxococcales bacterium]MDD9971085.1 chemotaxis protein CheW [Myxococcales bacterium]
MRHADEVCTFTLGELTFGVAVNQIREVLRAQPMTRVPLASPMVAGLINLRGQIVTALDLRARFELEPRKPGAPSLNVVVKTTESAVSLIVDDVGDVIELLPAKVEEAPSTLRGPVRELVKSVFKHDSGLILLLDVPRAVSIGGETDDGVAA